METNIIQVKKIMKRLVDMKPTPKEMEIFVNHPFIETRVLMTQNQMFDIFDNPDMFLEWKEHFKNHIDKESTTLSTLFSHIVKPYRLSVFKYISELLSEKDYGETLRTCWVTTEYNANHSDISKKEMVSLFKKANKQYLMDEDDYQTYVELPEKVIIYRGVRHSKYKNELSWTLDKDTAIWFAQRFESDNYIIYEVEIDKKDIFAYFNEREEEEIIIDPYKLKNYKIKEMVL